VPFKRVANYRLGYSIPTKLFHFDYELVGESSVNQIFLSPQEFMALADMFRNEGPIDFNTAGKYFVTAAEQIGEQEANP
jgi:hypothetical protein